MASGKLAIAGMLRFEKVNASVWNAYLCKGIGREVTEQLWTCRALCARFDGYMRRDVCAVPCGMRKLCRNCHRCFEECPDFLTRRCGRL